MKKTVFLLTKWFNAACINLCLYEKFFKPKRNVLEPKFKNHIAGAYSLLLIRTNKFVPVCVL